MSMSVFCHYDFFLIVIIQAEPYIGITPGGASQIYDRNATLFKRKFESIVRWVSQTIYDRSAVAF